MARILLLKASIPPGSRWITLHPGGPDSKGQPVLIQPQPDGSAHVIGGAGGKLNYLKLRGVRKESEYKREAEERKQSKAQEKKEQRQRDKENGILESKNKAKQALRDQQRGHERQFVQTVAQTMGWDTKQLEFQPPEGLSDAAVNKLAQQNHRTMMQRATQAVDLQRQRLVSDHAARLEAGIGEVPLDAPSAEQLSVQDLAPIQQNPGGLGFATNYKERAEAAGLTEGDLKAEAGKLRETKQSQMSDSERKAAITRGDTAKLVKAELEGIREPAAPAAKASLADAKQAVELLKAHKALKQVQQKARAAAAEIDKAQAEPKAFVLEYTADPDADADAKIAEDLNNDLRTAQTTAFLSEFKRLAGPDPTDTLGKHLGVGAYNSINSLALAVGGDALVDRSVVDVLGIAGAAQVLARRIHGDLPDQVERITEGVQEFHLHRYMEASEEAIGQARELMDAAKEVELGEAATGSDLQVAQELNARRRRAVGDAQKILGQALGEMEANAAIVVAMKQGRKDSFQVSLGKTGIEQAIQQVRAIGLQRGDYTIEHAAGNAFLTVNADGLDRLAKPIARADVEQVQRNLSIINGEHDEDGWLPKGVANRPDLGMDVKPGVAPRLAEPFQPGADLHQSLRDYIGGRAADGDAPADILADIQSADFVRKAGDADAYRQALDAVAPLKGEDGQQQRAEALSGRFEQYADDFVQARHGGERAPLHRQRIDIDEKSVDALHRALADVPEGVSAYKQIGELTNQDQRALREHFYRHVAKEDPAAGALRQELDQHQVAEPEREATDMFGESTVNPEHAEWSARRDELSGKVKAASLDWAKYAEAMGGHERAYEAVQDLIKSKVGEAFAKNHNKLKSDAPLRVGKSVIRNNLQHLDATDPAARAKREEQHRTLVDSLRERKAGRYAAGGVTEKLDAARDQREAFEQSQMGFFSTEEAPAASADGAPAELGGDERHTIGHVVERQIAGMMGKVGENFKPGQPVKLWAPSMSGGKNAARQRLVKMVDANKRVVAAFGTGSGKSLLQLAAFTHLHEHGKVKRGLALVPSIVQGQFSGEALRYLEPGKYKMHIEPGAAREERIAAYKDPSNHFAVMTHQSFRDDMIYLGAKHAGISEGEMSDRLSAMSDHDRKEWAGDLKKREGINIDYLTVDESQNTLNRAGKENSSLANVVDAFSHPDNTPHYLAASGDPVKNDASEVFDVLRKMDPARYTDRAAFMRRYGADTLASKDSLKREMARFVYPSRIDPDVSADKKESKLPLSAGQQKALGELDRHFANARMARMEGKVDVEAMRAISPGSFDGVDEDKHQAVAAELQKSIGILKSSAVRRVINTHPENPVIDDIAKHAAERSGKPGVVFAHSLEQVKMIADRLGKEGHRVVMLTGADSAQEKERKRLTFNPEQGEAKADILVASDAGATGMNLQRGQWLYQADTPDTAMAQPLDAKVLTPTGWALMGDIQAGDFILTPGGERARVTGVYPQGKKEIFSVKFSDGSSTRCCLDHLWLTKSRDDIADQRGWRVRTLEHIKRTLLVKEGGVKRPVYRIPLVDRIDFDTKELVVPPYLMGALLGDGEFGKNHVSLACVDDEILQRAKADAESIGSSVSHSGKISYRIIGDGTMAGFPAKRHSPVLHAVRALGIVGGDGREKFIPAPYFFARFEDRLALLQGLMDTDGTVDKRNGHASFCNTSVHLINGIVEITQSLGGIATVGSEKQSIYNGKTGKTHWKVSIKMPFGLNPFSLARKADRYVDIRTLGDRLCRGIVSIESCGEALAQCIMVDHPDHLYVTDDYIVTHNTHAQRRGRIFRTGQKNDVELIDAVPDHPEVHKARDRLTRKYGLRELMTSPMEGLDDTGVAHFLKQRQVAESNLF